jgi:hypothetical protein
MKTLSAIFQTTTSKFKLVKREGNIAIYLKQPISDPKVRGTYEVIRINRRNEVEIMGNKTPATEVYPGAASWGVYGLTAVNLEMANEQFQRFQLKFKGKDNLIGPKTEEQKEEAAKNGTVGRRGRKPLDITIKYPAKGEWTIKTVADSHKVCPAYVAKQMEPYLKNKSIIPTKREKTSSGRGKPAQFYKVAKSITYPEKKD